MRELIPPLYKAMKDLMQFVDADAAAYSEYMVSGGRSFCYNSKQQFYIFPYLDFKIIFGIILLLIRFSSSSYYNKIHENETIESNLINYDHIRMLMIRISL